MENFNLQYFLQDMRREQREDHEALSKKVDNVLDTVNNHETRITTVENTRKTLLWLGAALITALLTFVGDMIVNHVGSAATAVVAPQTYQR